MPTLARGDRRALARRAAGGFMVLPIMGLFAIAFLALGYVAYVLWPRWPEPAVAPDAPSLPIIVAGTLFNVPPAAMRVPVQRRPGTQERIDLVFLWPSLEPPDPAAKMPTERVFLSVSGSTGTLPPVERLRNLYPRYTESEPSPAPDGLTMFAFREGSPYQGEDLVFDPVMPEKFTARCSRPAGVTPGTCLYERRIGQADITIRFQRAWLADWRATARGIDRLIEQLRPREAP